MNIVLSTLGILAFGTPAFAGHGVEKVLPADASSVQIAAVTPGFILTSQTLISDGIDVKVTYQSKDDSDDETALSESGDGEEVVGGPTLSFSLEITADQAAAIKAHTLNPASLVNLSVTQQNVTFDNPVYTDSCVYNNDSGSPENADTCIKHVSTVEARPVLSVSLK